MKTLWTLLVSLPAVNWTWVLLFLVAAVLVLRLWIRSLVRREANLRDHVRHKTQELAREKERAVRSEKIKEEFLANMSHEIRTPMNAVVGLTNLLMDRQPRPDQEGYLQAIRHAADHLLSVINDILDVSRMEAGKFAIESRAFDLGILLDSLETMLGFKAHEKGITLAVNREEDVPRYLEGDNVRLNQILVNLAGNAVKFTEKGNVTIRAERMPDRGDDRVWIRFAVADTGIGIAAERLPHMFESFTQASNEVTRKFGGTGLGLAISRRLTEMMGGTLEAASEEGKGSVFTLSLPFTLAPEPSDDQPAEAPAEGLPEGLLILLAEDDPFNQMVAVDTIEDHVPGATVMVAANGKEAVEMAREHRFDLVLMDIQMPVMDGREATQLIRKEEEKAGKARLPILAMTANVLAPDRDRALASGMDDVIPKPFEVADLLARMRLALQARSPEEPKA